MEEEPKKKKLDSAGGVPPGVLEKEFDSDDADEAVRKS